MKKLIIILDILLLCGCTRNINFNISTSNITNIVYDNINILNSDFEIVNNALNNKTFYDLNDNSIYGTELDIKTKEYTYNFQLINNYLIYTVDNKRYFTEIDNLKDYLDKQISKYTDESFYTIKLVNNYNINKADYLIKLDNSNSFIIIVSTLNLYNFKIKDTSSLVDNNIINTLDNIDNNKIICIETSNPKKIDISFDNPYNYQIDISYNNDFIKNITAKEKLP